VSLLLAVAALAFAGIDPPAAAQQQEQPPLTPSLNALHRLSERELADRLLGPGGGLYREGRIFLHGNVESIGIFVTLAGAPEPSLYPGLCVARIADVHLTVGDGTGDPADRPSRITTVATSVQYRFVGDSEALLSNEAVRRRQTELCAAAGPVLGSPDGRVAIFGFFVGTGSDEEDIHQAGRALQQALIEARAGTLRITCVTEYGDHAARDCADPRRFLRDLPLARLSHTYVDSCWGEPSRRCANLMFVISDDHVVSLEIGFEESRDPEHPGVRVFGVRIAQVMMMQPD
jgi:hypothetical protein